MPEIQEISGKISTSVKPPHLPGTWHLAPDLRHLPPLSSFNSDPLIPSCLPPLFLSHHPPAALTLFLIASCAHPCPAQVVAIVCKAGKTNRSTLVVDLSHLVPPPAFPAKCLVDQHGWRIKSVHTPFSLFAI